MPSLHLDDTRADDTAHVGELASEEREGEVPLAHELVVGARRDRQSG
jgi:hypothetical protein